MEKEKITLPIGNNKALIFESDPGNKEDLDFVKRCQEVAATGPQSIQDFFIRLSNLEQKPTPETKRRKGNKI
ncbi:hypothetical protein [Chryseobacterium sp. 'Rf worker isolate 10']|uniref:hypothetical protein n=1 Tax=Chryseobacterium sp. 'Rf worker isolate 10' TaxID=2887348 RepID=UPI003D6ED8F9